MNQTKSQQKKTCHVCVIAGTCAFCICDHRQVRRKDGIITMITIIMVMITVIVIVIEKTAARNGRLTAQKREPNSRNNGTTHYWTNPLSMGHHRTHQRNRHVTTQTHQHQRTTTRIHHAKGPLKSYDHNMVTCANSPSSTRSMGSLQTGQDPRRRRSFVASRLHAIEW